MSVHVLFVHGAGLGAEAFDGLVETLHRDGVDASAPSRRGYDGRPPTADLGQHVQDLAAAVTTAAERTPGPVVVAGVSGGATLTLALAAGGHPQLAAAIVHEPLLGPLAPVQHRHITDSIRSFLDNGADDAIDRFLERLLSPATWAALTPEQRTRCRALSEIVRTEAPGFAAFASTGAELAAAAATVTWTVGRRSPHWRHEAAAAAAEHGVRVVTVDAGHTPQLECPRAWLDVVRSSAEVLP